MLIKPVKKVNDLCYQAEITSGHGLLGDSGIDRKIAQKELMEDGYKKFGFAYYFKGLEKFFASLYSKICIRPESGR